MIGVNLSYLADLQYNRRGRQIVLSRVANDRIFVVSDCLVGESLILVIHMPSVGGCLQEVRPITGCILRPSAPRVWYCGPSRSFCKNNAITFVSQTVDPRANSCLFNGSDVDVVMSWSRIYVFWML